MGELLRRFWMPVLLSEELPEADGDAEEDRGDGRGAARLPRLARRGRRHRSVLPASRRQSLARPQRGMRHPLRLSRLEVRHRRPLRRHADLLSRPQRQGQDPHQVLSGARMGRHDLGLYGPGGARCRNCPTLEMALVPASHRYVSKKWQDCNWVQALEGSIDTAHFTFAHLVLRQGRERDPRHQEALRQSADAHERPTTCAGSPRTRAP